ncbi:MAG: hypothetical protein HW421_689 [Ignavibacteria bacterium]|nr:hypothetical protein [Ignavibacteria bacterium]
MKTFIFLIWLAVLPSCSLFKLNKIPEERYFITSPKRIMYKNYKETFDLTLYWMKSAGFMIIKADTVNGYIRGETHMNEYIGDLVYQDRAEATSRYSQSTCSFLIKKQTDSTTIIMSDKFDAKYSWYLSNIKGYGTQNLKTSISFREFLDKVESGEIIIEEKKD